MVIKNAHVITDKYNFSTHPISVHTIMWFSLSARVDLENRKFKLNSTDLKRKAEYFMASNIMEVCFGWMSNVHARQQKM